MVGDEGGSGEGAVTEGPAKGGGAAVRPAEGGGTRAGAGAPPRPERRIAV